jgi:hypothetical protein
MAIHRYGLEKFDEADEEDQTKFLLTVQSEVAKVSIADPAISNIVNRMDEQFHAEVRDSIDATVKAKATAVSLYAQFKRLYTKDEMNGWPYPGTDKETVPANHSPDKVKKFTKTGQEIVIVWTNDLVSAMPEGKEFETQIENVKTEKKAPGSVPALKGKSKKDMADIVAGATQRRNALRNMVKRSIALHHQLEAVIGMPKIGFTWQKGNFAGIAKSVITLPEEYGKGTMGSKPVQVTMGPKPIWLYPSDSPSEGIDFSVTQFLNFDVNAAIQAGGSLADLVATSATGAQEAEGEEEGDGHDMSIDVAQVTFSQAVNFLNVKENVANLRRILADKKSPDRNDWIELIVDLHLLIEPEAKKCKHAYDLLKNEQLKANENEAEKVA